MLEDTRNRDNVCLALRSLTGSSYIVVGLATRASWLIAAASPKVFVHACFALAFHPCMHTCLRHQIHHLSAPLRANTPLRANKTARLSSNAAMLEDTRNRDNVCLALRSLTGSSYIVVGLATRASWLIAAASPKVFVHACFAQAFHPCMHTCLDRSVPREAAQKLRHLRLWGAHVVH